MELMKIIEQYQLRENLSLLLQNNYNEEELDKKEELIEYIIRFIFEIIKEQDNYQNINFEDLFQEVYLSVCEALNKKTINFNGGFEGFLKLDLKERLQLYFIKTKLKNLGMSEESYEKLKKYINVIKKLTKELERKPTTQEIASFLNISIKEVEELEYKIKLNSYIEYMYTSKLDEISFDLTEPYLRSLITRLLNNVLLTELELFVTVLYYGLRPLDKKSVSYKGISITLDGKSKNLQAIGDILSITLERCRSTLEIALQKLATSNQMITLGLMEYSENPDLVLRLKDIAAHIKVIPFTDKYPDIYSFFKEYTKEEVLSIIKTLDKYKLLLISNIKDYNSKVTSFSYNLLEKRTFYQIINNIYAGLIEKYGRRPMTTELSTPIIKPYGIWLNKLRDFYNIFFEFDKERVVCILSTLSDYQRETLARIFGFDLNRTLTPREILKVDEELIYRYDSLTNRMKNELTLEKDLLYKLPPLNNSKLNNGLSGIYQALGIDGANLTINAVNDQLSILFTDEITILKKVFGPELTDSNYQNRLNKLSEIEQKTYYNIISRLIDKLNKVKINNEVIRRRKNKVDAFRAVLIYEGYLQEEIDSIIETPSGLELLEEYIKWGTPKERREQIIKQIKKMLDEKYDVDVLTRFIMKGALPKKELKPRRKSS